MENKREIKVTAIATIYIEIEEDCKGVGEEELKAYALEKASKIDLSEYDFETYAEIQGE